MSLPRFFRTFWPAIFWLVLISVLFFLPGSAIPGIFPDLPIDKIVHVGIFTVLLFLWRAAMGNGTARERNFLLVASFVYAVGVEIVQGLWIANRSADYRDVVADMAGAVAGILIHDRYIKK
jgi:VanZ family protein